jgi:hypothetical protein
MALTELPAIAVSSFIMFRRLCFADYVFLARSLDLGDRASQDARCRLGDRRCSPRGGRWPPRPRRARHGVPIGCP